MTKANAKALSEFGESALALDHDFSELERLSAQIDRLAIDSDNGFEQARKLLVHFTECGQRIGVGVQSLARTLEEARLRAEKAAEVVSARATQVQARQDEGQKLLEKFRTLGEMVQKVTVAAAQIQEPVSGNLTEEQKALLIKRLPELDSQLGVLFDEASKLKVDAESAKMRALEKNAEALRQSLHAVRQKLSAAIDQSAGLFH